MEFFFGMLYLDKTRAYLMSSQIWLQIIWTFTFRFHFSACFRLLFYVMLCRKKYLSYRTHIPNMIFVDLNYFLTESFYGSCIWAWILAWAFYSNRWRLTLHIPHTHTHTYTRKERHWMWRNRFIIGISFKPISIGHDLN